MTTFDRTTILKGPCRIAYDSQVFFSRGDVNVTFSRDLFEKATTAFGKHGEGVASKFLSVSLAPVMYDANAIAALWPYGAKAPGDSLLDADDKTMVITPRNGAALTIKNVFVDVPPTITFASNVPLFGDVTLMGVCAKDADPDLAASYYEYGAAANGTVLPGFDSAKDINAVYSLTRGGTDFFSEAGFVLAPGLQTAEDIVNGYGMVGKTLIRQEPTVTFQPAGMNEAQISALQDFGRRIGGSDAGVDLTIQGQKEADILFTLKSTVFGPDNERRYSGGEAKRVGEIEFRSLRTATVAGALEPVYTFGTVPAPSS